MKQYEETFVPEPFESKLPTCWPSFYVIKCIFLKTKSILIQPQYYHQCQEINNPHSRTARCFNNKMT
jgi:hypothetical protein